MKRRVVGVIVAGGSGAPYEALGIQEDAALTPFGGKYRFVDFALAALRNSGVGATYVLGTLPAPLLQAHLLGAAVARREVRRSPLIAMPESRRPTDTRPTRLLRALAASAVQLRGQRPDAVVVLLADHILHVDLRQLCNAHRDLRADVTLVGLPVPAAESAGHTLLHAGEDMRVERVEKASRHSDRAASFALAWAGDLVISGAALSRLLARAHTGRVRDDRDLLAPLTKGMRVMAYDVGDSRLPGATHGAYWHLPSSLEAYYGAQMQLCTPSPILDLYNTEWPLHSSLSGLGPAKVVTDSAGRTGQALNSLLADGALIRGGIAINTILGHGVVIESGAEVEDSVLLDGCRIGRGAHVRRALVGAGAMIGDEEQIGFDAVPAGPARVLPSGLTIVPAHAPPELAAVAGIR
jgi:glucose-1-phosphate adenylyltransferase